MNPYIVLLKPRVIWLLILASAAGYIYAAPQIEWNKLASLLLVAALSIGRAAAFNHYWERDIDALMARTAKRPGWSGASQQRVDVLPGAVCGRHRRRVLPAGAAPPASSWPWAGFSTP
jgi:heme O synthase-like polyprenyltransferase